MKFSSTLKALIGALFFLAIALGAANAAEQGTAPEAEALVKKAVAYIKANGPEKSYEEFTNGQSFKDRDLYISVYDLKGNNLAHGSNPKLVGKNLMGLKDPEGVEFIKMITAVATEKGKGWSGQYKFLNPVTKALQSKVLYVERVGDTWVGVGIYK